MNRFSALFAAVSLASVLTACGDGSSPSSPSSTTPLPAGSDEILTGWVVDTVSQNPVAGALVETPAGSTRTDASGRFQLSGVGGVTPVTVSAPDHVTRRSFLSAATAGPTLDIIETDSLWNLAFYRELARNGAGGGRLESLNRWTMEPSFYIDRSPESGSDREIPDRAVELVSEAIAQVLPVLSRDFLRGDQIEIGTEPPEDLTPGSVVIRWDPVEISEVAGAASGITRGVGGNASVVVLRSIEETRVIFHEIGHVLGLHHPLGGIRPSLMAGPGTSEPPHFTKWDVFHANILYARPPGNTDIDNDPSGFLAGAAPLKTDRVSTTIAICTFP